MSIAERATPRTRTTAALRALFVNENIGGHATMHLHLREALSHRDDVVAAFLDVPRPSLGRRVTGARIPGLAAFDLDLQALRSQLALSRWVQRRLRVALSDVHALHAYTQNAVLLSPELLAERPSVVSTDATNAQNAFTLPHRQPGPGTRTAVRLTRHFESRVYAASTLVVAQSEWAAASLERDYGVARDRLRVIPFGMALGPAPVRARTDIPEITFVGTSMARKGGFRLLEVFNRHFRDRAVLNIVTKEPLAGDDRVRVFSDVRAGDGRVVRLLARTDVFAFPSEVDKSSYAVLEAMAAGVPVVATRMGAMPEIVEDGRTGLLIEVGDDRALAAALERLLGDAELRAAMGRDARQRAERRFDAEQTTAALVDTLGEAVVRFSAQERTRPSQSTS